MLKLIWLLFIYIFLHILTCLLMKYVNQNFVKDESFPFENDPQLSKQKEI